jgi:hypothetical protein
VGRGCATADVGRRFARKLQRTLSIQQVQQALSSRLLTIIARLLSRHRCSRHSQPVSVVLSCRFTWIEDSRAPTEHVIAFSHGRFSVAVVASGLIAVQSGDFTVAIGWRYRSQTSDSLNRISGILLFINYLLARRSE